MKYFSHPLPLQAFPYSHRRNSCLCHLPTYVQVKLCYIPRPPAHTHSHTHNNAWAPPGHPFIIFNVSLQVVPSTMYQQTPLPLNVDMHYVRLPKPEPLKALKFQAIIMISTSKFVILYIEICSETYVLHSPRCRPPNYFVQLYLQVHQGIVGPLSCQRETQCEPNRCCYASDNFNEISDVAS